MKPWNRFCLLACLTIWTVLATVTFAETPDAMVRYRDEYQLDSLGNARITRTMQFPPSIYASVKRKTQDPMMLSRSLAAQMDWHEIKILSSQFQDAQCQVVLELEQQGLARTIGKGEWEIRSKAPAGQMELITCCEDRVVFHGAAQSEWGPMSATFRLQLPPTFRNVHFDTKANAIRYQAEPLAEAAELTSRTWQLETAPRLMSSLAKVYGDEQFGQLWTARSLFCNSDDQPIEKFQIRFRLEGYSSWSPWKRTPIVYPGQTVVEAFFPVLDIDQMSQMDGSRQASLLAEYRYVDAEGNQIEESDSARIQILARNEVVFSRHAANDAVNWEEANEFLPMVLASFCTSNDPVIQQLAGRISGMANGPAASLANEDAVRYLAATWKFLEDNQVAYQTSPSLNVDQHFGQHIKYARDVLKNKAGTCIDLAVFWASTAKAVGLKSYVVVIPGHAFPVIELPNGSRIPVEATLLGKGHTLEQAVSKGNQELEEAMQGVHFLVDVQQYQDSGVRPLDLERVSEDFFEKLDYTFQPMDQE